MASAPVDQLERGHAHRAAGPVHQRERLRQHAVHARLDEGVGLPATDLHQGPRFRHVRPNQLDYFCAPASSRYSSTNRMVIPGVRARAAAAPVRTGRPVTPARIRDRAGRAFAVFLELRQLTHLAQELEGLLGLLLVTMLMRSRRVRSRSHRVLPQARRRGRSPCSRHRSSRLPWPCLGVLLHRQHLARHAETHVQSPLSIPNRAAATTTCPGSRRHRSAAPARAAARRGLPAPAPRPAAREEPVLEAPAGERHALLSTTAATFTAARTSPLWKRAETRLRGAPRRMSSSTASSSGPQSRTSGGRAPAETVPGSKSTG